MRRIGIAIVLVLVFLLGCTSERGTRDTLQKSGFSDIVVGGHAWFACDSKDFSSNHFMARNSAGIHVEGVVCCGIFKSCTVRF